MHRIIAVALALGLPATVASAKSVDDKTTWGAATAAAGLGALLEARDHPVAAAVLAAGAVYSYTQYDKARRDDRNDSRYDDPYGYTRGPGWRPGSTGSVRYGNSSRNVAGVVTRDTGVFDRDIRVRLDNGEERTIDVPKDIRVLRSGRTISVHDIQKGDYVRVQLERYRPDGDLDARRVEVIGQAYDDYYDRRDDNRRNDRRDDNWDNAYDRDETHGTVSSIDSRNGILRIRVNGRTVDVDVRRSDIRDSRGAMSLRDLQYGDRVTVYGRRNGDDIRATRVTVGY
jgi:hypothetical protein